MTYEHSIKFARYIISNHTVLLFMVMPDSFEVVVEMIAHYDAHDTDANEREWSLKMMEKDLIILHKTVEHDKKHSIL